MKYTTDILSEIQTWCHYADVVPAYETIEYGALYNWYAATDAREICGAGWHVPTLAEKDILVFYINSNTGGSLFEPSTDYWISNLPEHTNAKKFNGRGSGRRRRTTGVFDSILRYLYIWTSTQADASNAYTVFMGYNSNAIGGGFLGKGEGLSIRPLKDSTILTDGQSGTYTGNDGKVYRTICIGTQEWLADNLAETKYRNGDAIPVVTDNATWAALVTGAMCYYDNDISNA